MTGRKLKLYIYSAVLLYWEGGDFASMGRRSKFAGRLLPNGST